MRERLQNGITALRDPASAWHIGPIWRQITGWAIAILLVQFAACTFWGAVFLPGFTCTSALCSRVARSAGDMGDCEYAMRHYMRADGLYNLQGDPLPYNPQYNWRQTGVRLFRTGIRINYRQPLPWD